MSKVFFISKLQSAVLVRGNAPSSAVSISPHSVCELQEAEIKSEMHLAVQICRMVPYVQSRWLRPVRDRAADPEVIDWGRLLLGVGNYF